MTAIFFNLLTNSIFSLFCGLVVVGFFIWLFRVPTGPWRLFLLSLPFVKIIYDCVRGIPANSVLLADLDPFSLPPKHQLLQVGAGFSEWGPTLNVIFSVRNTEGKEFASSVGDYLTIWLNREYGSELPLIILTGVVAVSLTLLCIRLWNAIKFERKRKSDRSLEEQFRAEKVGFREVDIYVSKLFSGTQFTGGIVKPYICIPSDSFEKLNNDELEAVLKHELGHIRQFDLPATMAIQILGDLFWFVPGYRWLSRKIDRLREVVTDQWATVNGAKPEALASALITLKEIPETSEKFILYSAFFREKSLLKMRVERLISDSAERSPRFGWQYKWVRFGFSFWIASAVMFATIGGNHTMADIKNPEWFNQLLSVLGFQ
ncbi:MAG: M56 family metallopeptidase [Bdellovibrionaceae bacterium]|nr:M56 family metallopeptidase [Pseudobdellovibrionaceae bacterium]